MAIRIELETRCDHLGPGIAQSDALHDLGLHDLGLHDLGLHDLGSQQAVANVYKRCFETLPSGAVLVNGDFIKPDGTTFDYQPGRFAIERHFEVLRDAGFSNPQCLAHLEPKGTSKNSPFSGVVDLESG